MEKVIATSSSDYRHYIFAGNTRIAVYSRTTGGTNTLRYMREDHLGGVSSLLTSDGTTYVKESFTAFGDRRSACTWSGAPTNGQLARMAAATRIGCTCQIVLGSMGLNDMNGRIQDAVTGRFLSADPYVQDPTNTQSFNRYSYVLNNPMTSIDPSRFEDVLVSSIAGNYDSEWDFFPNLSLWVAVSQSATIADQPGGGVLLCSRQAGGCATGIAPKQPQGNPNQKLPEVCVGSGCPGHQSAASVLSH